MKLLHAVLNKGLLILIYQHAGISFNICCCISKCSPLPFSLAEHTTQGARLLYQKIQNADIAPPAQPASQVQWNLAHMYYTKLGINEISIVENIGDDKTQTSLISQDKNDLIFSNKDLLSNQLK